MVQQAEAFHLQALVGKEKRLGVICSFRCHIASVTPHAEVLG